jgi:hypothetical protein
MYGHGVPCPTNCRGSSDDSDLMTGSLTAHWYDAVDWKIVFKFLEFEQEARAGFWFLVLGLNKKLRNIET